MRFFERTRFLWRALCFAGLLIVVDGIVHTDRLVQLIGGLLCGVGASAGWDD